jgi:hypothetical protein
MDYIDNTLNVTDLNQNGIGETTFLYKLACRGDVSSEHLKLLMHESNRKYAIRGTITLMMNGEVYQKGEMEIDGSLKKGPEEFLEHALSEWKKYDTETLKTN